MKLFALFLFLCLPTASVYARDLPTNGNDLLEYCGAMVDLADNQTAAASLSSDMVAEKLKQLNWCAGYIQGAQGVYEQTFIDVGVWAMAGLTFGGPEKLRKYASESLRGPCFPANAPILQLARVLVKWLREHPERLHEYKNVLTSDAFRASFPCETVLSKEAAKPALPAKP